MRKLTIARISNEEKDIKKKVIKLDWVKSFEQIFKKHRPGPADPWSLYTKQSIPGSY